MILEVCIFRFVVSLVRQRTRPHTTHTHTPTLLHTDCGFLAAGREIVHVVCSSFCSALLSYYFTVVPAAAAAIAISPGRLRVGFVEGNLSPPRMTTETPCSPVLQQYQGLSVFPGLLLARLPPCRPGMWGYIGPQSRC